MKKVFFAFILMTACCSASSSDFFVGDNTDHQYMVSAVLRKGTTDIQIKLVHSLHSASTEDAALGKFVKQIPSNFPGYSVLTTLVTPVSDKRCDIEI